MNSKKSKELPPDLENDVTRRIIKLIMLLVRTRHDHESTKQRKMTPEEITEYTAIIELLRSGTNLGKSKLTLWVEEHKEFFSRFNILPLGFDQVMYDIRSPNSDPLMVIITFPSDYSNSVSVAYLR